MFIPLSRVKPEVRRRIVLAIYPDDVVDARGWVHTVMDDGETLWSLSEWITGRGSNYTGIMRAPANNLIEPGLRRGQKVVIPNAYLNAAMGRLTTSKFSSIKTIKAGKLSQLRAENQAMFTNLTWKDLVEGGFVIAGSPDTVRERMEHMIKTLRIGHVFGLFHTGNQLDWKTRYSSKLFAEKVMPKLRDVWPDHVGDDRWWCKPLEDRVRPEENFPVRDAAPGVSQ